MHCTPHYTLLLNGMVLHNRSRLSPRRRPMSAMEGERDLDVQRIGEEYIKDLQQQIYVLELENECLYPPQSLNSSASMPLAVSVSLCTFCVYAVGGGGKLRQIVLLHTIYPSYVSVTMTLSW